MRRLALLDGKVLAVSARKIGQREATGVDIYPNG